jgi:hypothetical protein
MKRIFTSTNFHRDLDLSANTYIIGFFLLLERPPCQSPRLLLKTAFPSSPSPLTQPGERKHVDRALAPGRRIAGRSVSAGRSCLRFDRDDTQRGFGGTKPPMWTRNRLDTLRADPQSCPRAVAVSASGPALRLNGVSAKQSHRGMPSPARLRQSAPAISYKTKYPFFRERNQRLAEGVRQRSKNRGAFLPVMARLAPGHLENRQTAPS